MIEVLVKAYGNGLLTDGQKAQPFQSTVRAGWPRFSLAVQLSSIPNRPKATMDGAIGIEIIGEFS
jgi:hypothetical protein